VSAVGYLSRALLCHGLAICSKPHTIGRPGIRQGRVGCVQFELFGPLPTQFLNYVRTVSVTYDSKWEFSATGTVQPFEELAAYRSQRVRDRFTSEMLERYCQAFGLDVFDPQTYGPRSVLFQSAVPLPANVVTMTLAEAQEWAEIRPGMAAHLVG